jgi:catechol 2,3-dioxygenase-like lactoylglutathione lyase family enzyme
MRARFAVLFLSVAAVLHAQNTSTIDGLDHVNIAVVNLDAAAARYRDLGFSLKPGTRHTNGIRNQHAKFPDGTQIELITAPEARDALTTTYRHHLEQGDAPAFLALFAPRSVSLAAALKNLELAYIFLGRRNHSPTDRPEHFAHANTADSLIAVWLAGADLSSERKLLQSAGATLVEQEVHTPDRSQAIVARLPGGDVLLLEGTPQLFLGRKIIGVTLRVRRLDTAQRALSQKLGRTFPAVRNQQGLSVFVPPQLAHGLWLEFRQPD